MPSRFVKRNQMVFDFTPADPPGGDAIRQVLLPVLLPPGFFFVPWSSEMIEPHADVLHRSFRNDLDGTVFTTFQQYGHCQRLIEAVAAGTTFLPEATILIAYGDPAGKFEYAANIQGQKLSEDVGAIQNVGVLPEFRQRGIGNALVQKALQGFFQSGVRRVTLEATDDNLPAMKLYRRIGFTTFRTYFREIFG